MLGDRKERKMHRSAPSERFFALFCISLALIFYSISADAQTPQQIANKSFQSVVLLVMEDVSGQPVSLGSGFFVRQEVIATNLHVVEGGSRGYAKIVSQRAKLDIEGFSGIDPERDLVLLKISAPSTPTLSLGNSDAVEVGEPVYAVGNPQGLEGTFSQGVVSSIRQVGSDKLLQITAPISPGSSGGPVLNSKGEVIGVSVATFRGGQNLNFAIPSNYLKTLLGKSGSAKPLAQAKPAKSQRSILSDLGGRSVEGVIGTNFTYDSSQFPRGDYSLSIINKLREPVRNVYCLIVFYDLEGNPLDVSIIRYSGVIPAGLAKRVKGSVEESVEKLNNPTKPWPYVPDPPRKPKGKIEFRILDFQIAESTPADGLQPPIDLSR
jgi:S1-C subfamily serine protease